MSELHRVRSGEGREGLEGAVTVAERRHHAAVDAKPTARIGLPSPLKSPLATSVGVVAGGVDRLGRERELPGWQHACTSHEGRRGPRAGAARHQIEGAMRASESVGANVTGIRDRAAGSDRIGRRQGRREVTGANRAVAPHRSTPRSGGRVVTGVRERDGLRHARARRDGAEVEGARRGLEHRLAADHPDRHHAIDGAARRRERDEPYCSP